MESVNPIQDRSLPRNKKADHQIGFNNLAFVFTINF